MQEHVEKNRFLVLLYPISGAAFLFLVAPFFVYLGFSGEFENLNPLAPKDYMFLMKRWLRAAINQNSASGKVRAKDL